MQYLTIDYRKEVVERIKSIQAIKDNLEDAVAELEEIRKRDPLARTKSASEYPNGNSGRCENHISIILDSKDKALSAQIHEWKTMLNDYNKGYRLLNMNERKVLDLRFIKGYSIEKTANELSFSIQYIKKIQNSMLRKMENNILKM